MKKINLKKIIRTDITQMEEYIPVASVWDVSIRYNQPISTLIKLDAGENLFGFSPKVKQVLANSGEFNYYPDPEYKELRKAIGIYTRVSTDNIFVSSGSDELIDLLLRLVLNKGEKIIDCPPTFGMYTVLTTLNKGIVVNIPRKKDFTIDVAAIKRKLTKGVKIIFICTPNNPTGTVTSKKDIISLLETGKLAVVDEAYFEFYGKTCVGLLSKYNNLVILRTFSKWAGLAGLRLGYGLMSSEIVNQLMKFKPPYNVNLAADLSGRAALKDLEYSKNIIQSICSERERLSIELAKIPNIKVFPSQANLLFIKINNNITKIKKCLDKNKITLRYYNTLICGQAIRMTIGRPKQNNKILKVFNSL